MRGPLPVLLCAYGMLAAQQPPRFADPLVCAACHSSLPGAPAGAGAEALGNPGSVAPYALWRGSMMAHSARDPYWRARVSFEAATTPAAKEVIEDTCLRCHAPMQQYEKRETGTPMPVSEVNAFGENSVSCTVCHQIQAEGLGKKESFEGGFKIGDLRQIFGPHANPFGNPMTAQSGYTPVESRHIMESSLCGTCHTVITPVLDEKGKVHGEFIEQAPFLEWLASDKPASGASCQSCHMPVLKDQAGAPIGAHIAHQPNGFRFFPPTFPRSPFGLHWLAGGNVPMLRLLAEVFPSESGYLKSTLQRTEASLESSMDLETEAKFDGGRIALRVKAINKTGHKLPTGFPSRRVWLHVAIQDREGKTVFESGGWNPATGEIRGSKDLEPHRNVISDPRETIIWEAEAEDIEGNVVISLVRSARNRKDNRILPSGFDAGKIRITGLDPSGIAPVGVEGDGDFTPGSDTVLYLAEAEPQRGPFRIAIQALYQSVKPSHAAALDGERSADEKRFLDLFSRHNAPAVIVKREVTLAP